MQEFSGLYRKMSEKAQRIQYEWIPEQWDDCFERGDYRDGSADIVRQKEMPKEEMENFKAKQVWLPRNYHINRMLGVRPPKVRDLVLDRYHNEFLKNEQKDERNR